MQTPPKASCRANTPRSISLEVSEKSSPRAAAAASKKQSPRQLKTSPRYSEPTASSLNLAATKPSKDSSPNVRKSPRSPLPEEKRVSRVAELESQISQLQNDLKKVKDQLCSCETSKKHAQKDAEESSQQLIALSSKLQESQKQVLELSASQKVEAIDSNDSAALELNKLRQNLEEKRLIVEEMKNQLSDCKKSEAQAQELVGETLMQLETAKKMVEALRSDGCKAMETHDALSFELEQSRARVNFLEELVSKLEAEVEDKKAAELNETEVEQLRAALEVSEKRHNEELAQTTEQLKIAFEMVEQMKSASGQREAELEAELRKSSYEIEELKANMMDKETELQGMCDENDALTMQLEREYKNMKARLKDKETEIKNASEENETLKLEMKEMWKANKMNNEVESDLEAARCAEREALMKIGCMREEMEKSSRKAARVAEQLEAAQAGNAEMEAELRKLRVQSDQWRKAAEVAASMLSVGNNNGQLVERTGSMDNNYSPRMMRGLNADDFDEDLMKKKNVNMLRRFGVLWKKPQK
ncbi:hypothetical protein ACS0TY_020901 [Phlomoides rotata]